MNKKIKVLVMLITVVLVITAAFAAFAGQENNFTTPCLEHEYAPSHFTDNNIYLICKNCDDTITYNFSDLAGKRVTDSDFVPLADLNNDGIINGKDYGRFLSEEY